MSDKKPDELIGSKVGAFTILEEIGRGGMATVYSATQHTMNRKVAVKILPRHFLHDPDFIERFEREVEVISHLEHPHILPIYDYGEADGVPFIAMRFLGGGSMAQMIRRGVPRLEDLVKPLHQVAEALDYAHQQGIIHRDLKPGNIMLDEHGNAYLSDFGIARVMGSNLTGSAIIGTPAYMSPEQAHGINIDARSDIYSLGIVLFELITGREPYQAETPMSLLMMQINEPIPPIGDFREGVPHIVQDVVNTATAKNPDERYPSATELADSFADALKGKRSSTTRVGVETKQDHEKTMVDNVTPLPKGGGTVIADSGTMRPSGALESPVPTDVGQGGDRAGLPMPAIAAAVVLLIVVFGGAGVYFFTDIFDPAPAPIELPEDFRLIQTENYSIGVPSDLLPAVNDFMDQSNANRILHRWQNDEEMYVTLALVNAERMSQTDYFNQYYSSEMVSDTTAGWTLIDDTVAEDGTARESYRVDGDDALANGQIDIFYLTRGEFLVVVEMYTSDAVASDAEIINNLQVILDSLRVTSDA